MAMLRKWLLFGVGLTALFGWGLYDLWRVEKAPETQSKLPEECRSWVALAAESPTFLKPYLAPSWQALRTGDGYKALVTFLRSSDVTDRDAGLFRAWLMLGEELIQAHRAMASATALYLDAALSSAPDPGSADIYRLMRASVAIQLEERVSVQQWLSPISETGPYAKARGLLQQIVGSESASGAGAAGRNARVDFKAGSRLQRWLEVLPQYAASLPMQSCLRAPLAGKRLQMLNTLRQSAMNANQDLDWASFQLSTPELVAGACEDSLKEPIKLWEPGFYLLLADIALQRAQAVAQNPVEQGLLATAQSKAHWLDGQERACKAATALDEFVTVPPGDWVYGEWASGGELKSGLQSFCRSGLPEQPCAASMSQAAEALDREEGWSNRCTDAMAAVVPGADEFVSGEQLFSGIIRRRMTAAAEAGTCSLALADEIYRAAEGLKEPGTSWNKTAATLAWATVDIRRGTLEAAPTLLTRLASQSVLFVPIDQMVRYASVSRESGDGPMQ